MPYPIYKNHQYLALDNNGEEYVRDARTIEELPYLLRRVAITRASRALGLRVEYGRALWISNKVKPSDVRNDASGLLAKRGCELPLQVLTESNVPKITLN